MTANDKPMNYTEIGVLFQKIVLTETDPTLDQISRIGEAYALMDSHVFTRVVGDIDTGEKYMEVHRRG